MKADLFIPCFIDQLYPRTARQVWQLLERCGVGVRYPAGQTCCGQPAFNSGHLKIAADLARKFLVDFKDAETIVAPSASCIGYIKNYYHLLLAADDPAREQFLNLRPKMYELTDFLVNVLQKEDVGASFPHRVTYHDACTALREYGLKDEPRRLLNHVRGLELVEMNDRETCCGFGGTFSVKFTAISTAMTEQKIEHALATGAEFITSTESSCLMNLESYIRKNRLPLKTIHIAGILAGGLVE